MSADRIAKQIIEYNQLHHGGLILCQKVIHPSIKTKLKQNMESIQSIDLVDNLHLIFVI